MDQHRFDTVRRQVTSLPSRRDVLRGLAGAGLGLGSLRLADVANAKKKRKRKGKKKAKPNEFGCLEVGDPCQRDGQCCSGLCAGKKGKKQCQAHGTGTCPQDVPGRCADPSSVGTCNGSLACSCFRTTARSIACLDVARGNGSCVDCRTDADCLASGMPAGSACVPASEGPCADYCAGGAVCLAPCPSAAPQE